MKYCKLYISIHNNKYIVVVVVVVKEVDQSFSLIRAVVLKTYLQIDFGCFGYLLRS